MTFTESNINKIVLSFRKHHFNRPSVVILPFLIVVNENMNWTGRTTTPSVGQQIHVDVKVSSLKHSRNETSRSRTICLAIRVQCHSSSDGSESRSVKGRIQQPIKMPIHSPHSNAICSCLSSVWTRLDRQPMESRAYLDEQIRSQCNGWTRTIHLKDLFTPLFDSACDVRF